MLFKLLLVLCTSVSVFTFVPEYSFQDDSNAISRLRQYLRIDTSTPENIGQAVEFWQSLAESIGLPMSVYEPDGMPIVVITWEGSDPSLPSIMLNSHMDVVPANEDEWKYPPYSGYIDENGDIYGRGAQDTKDVGMQYFEAIRKLIEDDITLLRTVHLTLMPDEETGGFHGIKPFVETKEFEDMNVGFALDEGLSSSNDTLLVFYQDRRPWQMEFTVYGEGGHGFAMPDDNAAEKVSRIINKVFEFRKKNIEIMKSNDRLDFGKYTSVNVNIIKGGKAVNVIPSNFTIQVDMRLSTESQVEDMNSMVKSWMMEAGPETQVTYHRKEDVSGRTELNDNNHYWMVMKNTLNSMGYNVTPLICPATSDMLVLRNLGFPAVGFSPKIHTTSRIHDKDEYINVETYLNGIDIYYEVIKNVANVPDFN